MFGGTRLEGGGGVSPKGQVIRLALSVPGEKGAILFYMIPLERWNTEHSFCFLG